ncbi:MAG: exosome complex RNA-binding protein Rrp4 [Nitrososphaerota archaeon]|nr:exosome complex RNA-binding protein Rrp4 [Candidatus Bathyarchaeota archaeon]MDW8048813.1 exosome complex RNA-binding protein Rrp4 [Nitrososphaerota archaeon]
MSIFFGERQIVTPGDLLAEGDFLSGHNTYKYGSKIYASRLGLAECKGKSIQVVALNNFYIPSVGDLVIGKIVDINMHGWTLDINSPYLAILKASEALKKQFRPQKDELSEFLDVGDLVFAKIIAFDRTRNPSLTIREPELGKITHGQIVKVSPAKIPRIIGRKGSMITMLKRETECNITVGQNGLIHISGKDPENERIAILAIRKIEQEAHTSGLTDRVTEMIRKERGQKIE